jgi:hypothetical protein
MRILSSVIKSDQKDWRKLLAGYNGILFQRDYQARRDAQVNSRGVSSISNDGAEDKQKKRAITAKTELYDSSCDTWEEEYLTSLFSYDCFHLVSIIIVTKQRR